MKSFSHTHVRLPRRELYIHLLHWKYIICNRNPQKKGKLLPQYEKIHNMRDYLNVPGLKRRRLPHFLELPRGRFVENTSHTVGLAPRRTDLRIGQASRVTRTGERRDLASCQQE